MKGLKKTNGTYSQNRTPLQIYLRCQRPKKPLPSLIDFTHIDPTYEIHGLIVCLTTKSKLF